MNLSTEDRRRKLIQDIIHKYEGLIFAEKINRYEGRISKSDYLTRIKFINDEKERFLEEARTASSRDFTIIRDKVFPEP